MNKATRWALLLALLLAGCPKDTGLDSLSEDDSVDSEEAISESNEGATGIDRDGIDQGGVNQGGIGETGGSTDQGNSTGDGGSDGSTGQDSAGSDEGGDSSSTDDNATCPIPCDFVNDLLTIVQALQDEYLSTDTQQVRVTADLLNVRDRPTTGDESTVLDMVEAGTVFDVLGESLDGEWYLVAHGDGVAWVSAHWTTSVTSTDSGTDIGGDQGVATSVGLPLEGAQTPLRATEGTTWWISNNSPYHTETGGYRGINDSQARDYSSANAAGQPVYSIADGGEVVVNVACTYSSWSCSNCAEQNRLVIVRYENPEWGEEGEPHYYYAEYLHIQSDVQVGDTLDTDEPFGTIQTEGPKNSEGEEQMTPHLHFSLFTSDSADVFDDWSVDELDPVDMDLIPGVSVPEGPEPRAAVSSSVLNVRDAPSTEGTTVLGTLSQGEVVDVVGRNHDGTWYQITWQNGTAWVYGDLLLPNEEAQAAPVTD